MQHHLHSSSYYLCYDFPCEILKPPTTENPFTKAKFTGNSGIFPEANPTTKSLPSPAIHRTHFHVSMNIIELTL